MPPAPAPCHQEESSGPRAARQAQAQIGLQANRHNFMVQSHPLTGTHPLTVSPRLRKVSLASTPHSGDWVTLLPNSHPWFPSLQGIKPDLHRQAVKALHDPASANFSCLISTPPPHTPDYKTCLAPASLRAFAQADPSFTCPSSPLSSQILLKCHLLYEALPKPSNHSGLFAPQRCLSLRAPFGQF